MNLLKLLWKKWMAFSLVFGTFMSRVILTVLYFLLLLPYGILIRLFSDPLQTKTVPKGTAWKPHAKIEGLLDKFTKQY